MHAGLIDSSHWGVKDAQIQQLRYRVLTAQQKLAAAAGGSVKGLPRVFVYDAMDVPAMRKLQQSPNYCNRGMWGMEVSIHEWFLTSPLRTLDPYEADFFLVPCYAICMLEGNILQMDEINALYIELVTALPHFNRTHGRDHVFTFTSGMYVNIFRDWKQYIPESIILTPETELFNDFTDVAVPAFSTWRDIVVPGNLDLAEVIGLLELSRPLAERDWIASFFGKADLVRGPHPWVGGVDIRKHVFKLNASDDVMMHDSLLLSDVHMHMGRSKFCLIPRGKSAWSLRLFETLFSGCVPVLLSDKWELPFESFLDVTRFSIKWPVSKVGPELLDFLRAMPDAEVQRYMDEAQKMRCWYFYAPKPTDVRAALRKLHDVCMDEQVSAFHGIVRELAGKVSRSKTSRRTFHLRSTDRIAHFDHLLREV